MRVDAARHPAVQVGPLFALTLALTLALHAPPALAQGSAAVAPETRDMIEALKPSRNRNLLVRQTPTSPAAAASSLSTTTAALPAGAATPAPVTATAPALALPPLPPAATSTAATTPITTPTSAVPLAPTPSTPPSPAPSKPPVLVSAPTPAPPAAPPRPVSPATAAGPVTAEPAPSLSLAIQFELNSARVRPESGPVLGNLVAAMTSADLKAHRFVIEGHTDARGNPATNQLLSQQRADEVRLYLVALGVHPSRLRAVGKGSSELVNARDPLSADNRRVRVVTLE